MNIIETHDLTRRFGRTEAVEQVNLAVPAGSICALLGPNGAGKSTTIKLLLNLVRASAGRASVLGVDSRRLGEREWAQIGYVAEDQQLPGWMTVRQWLDYCRPHYATWDANLERTLLARFELPPDRRLRHLSRGMRMKAALLVALAFRPRLLVLDEPFSGLDPVVRDEFVRGILETAMHGEWTVLVSSHDVEEVERMVDQVAFLEGGRLRVAEPVDVLRGRFRRVEVVAAPLDARATAGEVRWEQAGNLTRFVTTAYRDGASEQAWRNRFAGAELTATPMSLRDIFVALAGAERPAGEENAS